jgi:DNA-binding SARP family transcriptional activator
MNTADGRVIAGADACTSLSIVGGFELTRRDGPLCLSCSMQRLVSFLALHERPLSRARVAAVLWPDVPETRSAGNLRSVLWRLRQSEIAVVETEGASSLRLAAHLEVDFRELAARARRLLGRGESFEEADLALIGKAGELLPDCSEDWVLHERDSFRQLRAQALERLCEHLVDRLRFGEAVDAALAAVASEPLSESAHRCLICAYLAEGNLCQAVRHYEDFRETLRRELHLDPSAAMLELFETRLATRLSA